GTEATLADLEGVLSTDALPEPIAPKEPAGSAVEFDRLSWCPQGNPVLDRVSLSLAGGELIAIVGPSGAGKSSLLHLLARFHDVDGGAVRIGGVDVRDMTTQTLSQ